MSGSCPGGEAGSSSDHVDLVGPLPVIWAISFGDHIHSRSREALVYPSGNRTRLAPAGLPSTRATCMARLLTELPAALQPAASRSLSIEYNAISVRCGRRLGAVTRFSRRFQRDESGWCPPGGRGVSRSVGRSAFDECYDPGRYLMQCGSGLYAVRFRAVLGFLGEPFCAGRSRRPSLPSPAGPVADRGVRLVADLRHSHPDPGQRPAVSGRWRVLAHRRRLDRRTGGRGPRGLRPADDPARGTGIRHRACT